MTGTGRGTGGMDARKLSIGRHFGRLALLAAIAALLLGWLGAHTDILFADGLRYISQARAYSQGTMADALRAVDHPVYPLAIVAAHRLAGGERPEDWQKAAQLASIASGLLLVLPLYLVSRELFGDDAALPGVLLFYVVPLTGHVFADTLSESTFLLFWAWGLWTALRFLKTGAIGWVPLIVAFSGLAYLTRPEGLLLPAAVLAALMLSPLWVAQGLGRRGLIALGVLVIGSAALVGPYVALKGGLGTKPSIARLLGLAPKSAPHAVERHRPLDPDQSEALTLLLAGKAVFKAVTEAVTWPLVPFAALGLGIFGLRCRDGASRQGRLIAVIALASVLALLRLHATGGYCSPRHAMILSLMAIPASGFGLSVLLNQMVERLPSSRYPVKCLGWAIAFASLMVVEGPAMIAPVNQGLDGYREAGRWLAAHDADRKKVVDVTGWSQFYGGREGYTFENLVAAGDDPSARWVVVREAHLKGPWEYCQRLRALVDGLEPVEVFQGSVRRRPTKVYIYDRQTLIARQQPPGAIRR